MGLAQLSWMDLPNDNYENILGYSNHEVEQLNKLSQAYHDIPKDDEASLQVRVDRLEDISDHLTSWLKDKQCPKTKTKHLVKLMEISEKKINYLLALIKIASNADNISKCIEDYHYDLGGRNLNPTWEVLYLNKLRMYSIKKEEAWGDFWTVTLDPCHRQLTNYLQTWEEKTGITKPSLEFFLWLETQHVPKHQPTETYIDSSDATQYELTINKAGLLITQNNQIANFSDKEEKYLFVVDLDKKLYVIEETSSIFHSSICKGKPVLSAGKIVIEDGKVKRVSFESGHYISSIKAGYQLFIVLIENHHDFLDQIEVSYFYDRNKYTTHVDKQFLSNLEDFSSKLKQAKSPTKLTGSNRYVESI